MNPINRLLKKLRRNERGAVLVEMALSLPLYIILLSGVVEAANYLILNLKLQHTVNTVSDLVTRDDAITDATMTDIFSAVPTIMAPYPTTGDSTTIVTAISQSASVPTQVYWQRENGSLSATSEFGTTGSPVNTLPDGLTLRDDETILATEIFYQYKPLIFDFLPSATLHKIAYFRPRIGALQTVN
ncbi:TadE/TadG family type IV pilus assembly protein [Kordiimonas marina]|uniref:TadE/TadG family type IV pilus assembly protein n=1 Tax=Kordiimonas marina TaxID=2872312 RepID=UPI001FF58226|nr:TadE/TadG family type IV pilus assembly protein [Kordiimonas marina]MCJ9428591.1 pilus assembly protein [Kordiimonas marina]